MARSEVILWEDVPAEERMTPGELGKFYMDTVPNYFDPGKAYQHNRWLARMRHATCPAAVKWPNGKFMPCGNPVVKGGPFAPFCFSHWRRINSDDDKD